jgi:hypothetical protein
MLSKSLRLNLNLILLAIVGWIPMGCDNLNSLLPETFQEENQEMSAIDYTACEHLTDSSQVQVSSKMRFSFQNTWVRYPSIPDTSWIIYPDTEWVFVADTARHIMPLENWVIVPDSNWLIIPGATWIMNDTVIVTVPQEPWASALDVGAAFIENKTGDLISLLITEVIDSLADNEIELDKATGHSIITANREENLTLFTNEGVGRVIIYADNDLSIAPLRADGSLIEVVDNSITVETVAGCVSLKTRVVFQLEDEQYVLRFLKTAQTQNDTLRVTILNDE